MQGVLLSTGAASFLLFWETMSISSFFLVMADGEEESRRAALLYLAVAQFGAGALLVGMGMLSGGVYAATLQELGAGAAALSPAASTLATSLVLFAFVSKAGLAPFHAWLPEAHPRAPSHISALMSGVMLKTALYGLLRFLAVCWPALPAGWGIAMLALGLGGAAVAVIYANLARDIKRILAWSSVENIGLAFTMLGFSVLARSGGLATVADAVLAAMFLHVLSHGLFKSGLFLGAGAVLQATHTAKIELLGGLASRMPRLSAAMLGLSLAAAALPPFGSFVAEWTPHPVAHHRAGHRHAVDHRHVGRGAGGRRVRDRTRGLRDGAPVRLRVPRRASFGRRPQSPGAGDAAARTGHRPGHRRSGAWGWVTVGLAALPGAAPAPDRVARSRSDHVPGTRAARDAGRR